MSGVGIALSDRYDVESRASVDELHPVFESFCHMVHSKVIKDNGDIPKKMAFDDWFNVQLRHH